MTLNDKVYNGSKEGSSSDVTSVTFNGVPTGAAQPEYKIESVTYDDANASTSKQNVKVKVTLKNSNYTFANSSSSTLFPTTGKITKAPAPGTGEVSHDLNVVNNEKKNYTLDLSTLLPKLPDGGCDYGTKTYGPVSRTFLSDNYNGGGIQLSNDGTLILPIAAANTVKDGGKIGTVTVTAKTQNYTDITLTINVIASAAEKTDPEYTAPTAQSGLVYTGKALALINEGSATGGTMQYCLSETGVYSTEIPMATNAGDYTVYYKVVGDATHNNVAEQSIEVTIAKAKPTGEPIYTKITAAKKTLADADLKPNSSWPTGTVKWERGDNTEVEADTAYKWIFTPKDSANYETLTGTVVLYTKSTPVRVS